MIAKCPNCGTEIEVKRGLNYCHNCNRALVLNMKDKIDMNVNTLMSIIPAMLLLGCIPVAGLWYLFNKNNVIGFIFLTVLFSSIISYPASLILQYKKYNYILTKMGILLGTKAIIFILITGISILALGFLLIRALIIKSI